MKTRFIRLQILVTTLFTVSILCSPLLAQDDTPSLEEMWRIIQQQQAEIDELKKQNAELRGETAQAPAGAALTEAGQAVADVQDPEYEKVIAPTGTVMDLYGAAMLDMGYQGGQSDPDWFDVVRPTKLPSYKDQFGEDGNFFSGVRQSRLGVSTSTPTKYGDLKTIFEFELFGVGADAGQTTFRLRHAWGELGKFGAGQYWSTFMDIDVFPNSIEYWGPSGMIFYRNVQARWTPWSTDSGSRFAISLERPGGSGDQGRLSDLNLFDGVQGDFELPDLAAHYRVAGDWGHVQAAGILREIRWTDTMPDERDLSGDELGWGVNLSTNVNLGPHVFRGSLTYGEGIQNYFNDAAADIGLALERNRPDAPFSAGAIPVLGLVAFLDLNWSEQWTSTVGYSLQDNDLPDLAADTSFERGQYALANLLYHPVPNVFFGPELQWAKRDNYGPFSSDDFRIQFSAKWNFNYLISGN